MHMEPLHFLPFPILHGVSTPGGSSPGSRQSSAAGGKSVSLLWKGKLSPGRREGEPEYRPSHLWSSPWHTAPLHLPLVGQNCWPHMAPGFSASMWLWLAELEKSEDKGWFHWHYFLCNLLEDENFLKFVLFSRRKHLFWVPSCFSSDWNKIRRWNPRSHSLHGVQGTDASSLGRLL